MTSRTYHAGKKAAWYCRDCRRTPYRQLDGGIEWDGHRPCTRCCGYTTDPSRWLKERDTR